MKDYAKIFATIGGFAAMIFGGYMAIKCKKIADKVDVTIDEIDKSTPVEVSDAVVKAAVKKAVDREVESHVRKVAEDAIKDIKDDISHQAKAAVKQAYGDVKDNVAAELRAKIGEININSVRQEVVDEAKREAARKFDDDLRKVVDEYDDRLRSVGNIYNTIANTMQQRASKLVF